MDIRWNFIVKITLIVIHLSFIIAQDGYESLQTDVKQNPSVETGNSRGNNSIDALNHEIDTLTNQIQSITNNIQQLLSDATNTRRRRSNLPPGFNRPSSDDKLKSLEAKVKSMVAVIDSMKNSTDNSDTAERLSSLETATENLETIFDDLNRRNIDQMNNRDAFIDNLTAAVRELKQRLDRLEQHFNEKFELEKPKLLRSAIIEDIKGRYFVAAAEKLRNLTGGLQRNINLVVHEVYNNQAGNFDLILLFGDNEDVDVTTSIAVYVALTFEMESNEHNDYMKLLKLLVGLNWKMIHPTFGPTSQTFDDALMLQTKLQGIIKERIASEILNAIVTNNSQKVSEMFEKIYKKYTNSFNNIIKDALSDVVRNRDIEKLLTFFETLKYPSQKMLVYSAAFDELKKNDNLDHAAVVTIAFGMKSLLDEPLDVETVIEMTRVRNALPTSVLNLSNPVSVCIKNTNSNEYLYASVDYFNSGNNRRVFAWISGESVNQGVWSIDKKVGESKYFIRNNLHVNESLFASVNEYDNDNSRNVYTINPNSSDNLELFAWTFEPSGNNVYIKNTLYNEYLYASDNSYDSERRLVYTSTEKNKPKGSLWTIEECY